MRLGNPHANAVVVGDNGTYQIMFHAQVEMTRKPTTRPECINNWPRRVLGAAKASRRHALAEWKKASSAFEPHSSEKFPVEFSVADNSQSDAMFPIMYVRYVLMCLPV